MSLLQDAAAIAAEDVINSATPLETDLVGVHPRIYLREKDFAALADPAAPALVRRTVDSLVAEAERHVGRVCPDAPGVVTDPRIYGTALPCLALAWRMTGDARFLTSTRDWMDALGHWPDWGDDLIFGHFANGYAVALDWLWHDFAADERQARIDVLARNVTVVFDHWRAYRSGTPFSYTWNHHTVPLSAIAVAGSVLYGERPAISPWLNMALEKVRCITAALGPDGVSPESMAYGAYFSHYLMRSLLVLRDLSGVDLLSGSAWWREYSLALVHHTLPRQWWSRSTAFLMFGDTDGRHWYGPDPVCHILAGVFADGHAQWLADAVVADEASETVGERIISLGSLDPTVSPIPPDELPRVKLFADQGMAIGRSDWSGDERVWSIRSGPPMAYSGHATHRNPIAGGHMHAFAGTFQIVAHGDLVVAPPGYAGKYTRYNNTLLIDGEGQIGESRSWYEDLEWRRGRPLPSLTMLSQTPDRVHLLADLASSYPDERGVLRAVRHFLALDGDTWLIVDRVETARPATVSALVHTSFPLAADGDGVYRGSGTGATAACRPLWPPTAMATTETQEILYTDGTPHSSLELLTVQPAAPATITWLAMLIRVGHRGDDPDMTATARLDGDVMQINRGQHRVTLNGGP